MEAYLQSAVILSSGGRYHIRAEILSVEQPFAGLDLMVSVQVRYNLIDASGRIRFDKIIKSAHTATFNDAALAVERLKKANEGAARENIRLFLNELGTQVPRTTVVAVS